VVDVVEDGAVVVVVVVVELVVVVVVVVVVLGTSNVISCETASPARSPNEIVQ
jgi:hypothetical protein